MNMFTLQKLSKMLLYIWVLVCLCVWDQERQKKCISDQEI